MADLRWCTNSKSGFNILHPLANFQNFKNPTSIHCHLSSMLETLPLILLGYQCPDPNWSWQKQHKRALVMTNLLLRCLLRPATNFKIGLHFLTINFLNFTVYMQRKGLVWNTNYSVVMTTYLYNREPKHRTKTNPWKNESLATKFSMVKCQFYSLPFSQIEGYFRVQKDLLPRWQHSHGTSQS